MQRATPQNVREFLDDMQAEMDSAPPGGPYELSEPDGSYEAIWFRNSVAGTASVLEALVALRLVDTPMAQGAASWLRRAQRPDGSWGGDAGQSSTVEETAWACHALTLWQPQSPALSVEHGLDWLIRHQRADGTWPQAVIGLYFSTLWYSDSMYAVALPLRALATLLWPDWWGRPSGRSRRSRRGRDWESDGRHWPRRIRSRTRNG